MTSSISSLKRKEPSSSSSRVMASEISTGCRPEGSSPTMTTVPPRTAPLMAEASPWWLPEDSITTSASTAAIAVGVVALQDLVRAHGAGYLQRPVVHVHGDDPPGAGALEDGHGQRADGAAADHQRRLPATSPARDTACQATLAGSTSAAVRRSRPAGSGRSIRAGSLTYRLNAPSVCGKRAALPR